MALKSEQAQVLRRRVLGSLVRNLTLFSLVFLLAYAAFHTFVTPSLAALVADNTSTWRTLDVSEALMTHLTGEGLSSTDTVKAYAKELEGEGYAGDPGTANNIAEELSALNSAIEAYANGALASADIRNAGDALASLASQSSADAPDSSDNGSATEVDAIVSGAGIYTVDSIDEEGEGAIGPSRDRPRDDLSRQHVFVPFISGEEILIAGGINPSDASAAQALAAVRLSAIIQELSLSLTMPDDATDINATAVLSAAAAAGMDEETLANQFNTALETARNETYGQWSDLAPADQALSLGIDDTAPIWQVEQGADGVYQMRDIALYTFVKSFKLPLALLAFAIGWLLIMFRALNRSLSCFDELSGAVGRLLADKDAPIELPADLSIARNELAVIRSQSLADERAAHAAEQRKNELVAYLAHDIRTPLTSVLGYLDLLSETTDLPRETLRKYADIAYSKAERLESLINEFFEITRYNLSAIPIERETVGVRLFCQQVAEAFFPEAAARNIRITVDAAGAGQFFIDPDKLARALGNVLRNAVAYADANSIIAIAARQDARTTTITVSNRGREISDAHLETIFEKFYREDGARSSKKGGAGLGLAIAREIVVAHHGDIEAASERGVTVFTLRIPTQGDKIEGTAAAPHIPGERGGVQRPVAPVPPRTVRQTSTRATSAPPSATTHRGSSARPIPQRPVGERTQAPRQGTSPLNPRNARHGQVPARKTVRDNDATPRRRGLSR